MGAENAGRKNAKLENYGQKCAELEYAGLEIDGPRCRAGKCVRGFRKDD